MTKPEITRMHPPPPGIEGVRSTDCITCDKRCDWAWYFVGVNGPYCLDCLEPRKVGR